MSGIETKADSRVRAVMVNHNGAALTADCLKSLAGQSYRPLDIVVVDDYSKPSEWLLLQQAMPAHVLLIRQSAPSGYAASLNAGMKSTELPPAEFMVAMNNDLFFPDPDTISRLVRALQEDSRRVAASPLIRHVGVALHPEIQVRRVPDFRTLLVTHSPWLRRMPWFRSLLHRYTYGEYRPMPLGVVLDCETINGALFLLRTSFLESIGFLDEGSFLYGEELILGAQMKGMNRTGCLVTSTSIDHLQGASTGSKAGTFRLEMWRHQVRSELWYMRKYLACGPAQHVLFALVRAVDAVAKVAQQAWLDLWSKRDRNTAARTLRGMP